MSTTFIVSRYFGACQEKSDEVERRRGVQVKVKFVASANLLLWIGRRVHAQAAAD